jgi:hypothetical protein
MSLLIWIAFAALCGVFGYGMGRRRAILECRKEVYDQGQKLIDHARHVTKHALDTMSGTVNPFMAERDVAEMQRLVLALDVWFIRRFGPIPEEKDD